MGGSVLQTTANKRQADSGWAEGRGSWELQPALCWTQREVHKHPNLFLRRAWGGCRAFPLCPQRNAHQRGGGSTRLHPLHLQLMHSQQSRQQGSQPPPHRPHRWDLTGLEGTWTIHPPLGAGGSKGHHPYHLGSLDTIYLPGCAHGSLFR